MAQLKINTNVLTGLRSVASTYVLEFANVAEACYKIDGEKLLRLAGLDKKQIESDQQEQIPAFHLFTLILHVARLSKDEALGLHIGQELKLKAFHMLGYVLMNCKNLREGLERTLRYEKLVMETSLTTYTEKEGKGILTWKCPYEGPEAKYFRELIITGWLCISQQVTGNKEYKSASAVYFPHSMPSQGTEEYEKTYQCPVHFDAESCSVIFESDFLNTPYVSQDPVLGGLMEQYAELMLCKLNNNVSILSEARSAIYRLMPTGDLTFERFAEEVGHNQKAISNKLKQSGVTYSELVDDVRRILAMIYLENPQINLLDVALLVGFTDQSSFTRAFKRWQNERPGDYRKKALRAGGLYTGHMDKLLEKF